MNLTFTRITGPGENVCALRAGESSRPAPRVGSWIFLLAMILTIVGMLFVVDTSLVFKGDFDRAKMMTNVSKQMAFIFVGWLAAFYVRRMELRTLKIFGALLMFGSLLMLFLVITTFLGVEKNGSHRWFGYKQYTIQPLEFFKVAVIMQLAAFLSSHGSLAKLRLHTLIKPGIAIGLGLLFLALQPNGSAIMLVCLICIVMALIGGLPWKPFLLFVGGCITFGIIFLLFHPDRLARIIGMWNITENISGAGYQLGMALYAIARGGVFGVGLGQSIGKFALPYNGSDFIFTIIVEETGLLGAIALVALFVCLIFLILKLARAQVDNYKVLLCLGAGVMIGLQALINIAVNIGVFPTTGMPLPFISSGGSNLIATLIAIGLVLNISVGENPGEEGALA